MRIKDYAKRQGVSSQSIYKRIRSDKYKKRLKGHLYLDNQKVENLDLIGIQILEDYPFEQDVIELEKELQEVREKFATDRLGLLKQIEKAEKELQKIKNDRTQDRKRIRLWSVYVEQLETQRFYLMIVLVIVFIAFLIAMYFAVF